MSEQGRRLRVAVAGAGLIGRRHVQLVLESGECELDAIVDPAPAARDIARRAGVELHARLEDLLAARRPDGIILATPSRLHLEHALTCIAAGVPVLVEKPIATSVTDGLRIARAADAGRVPLLVGHHRRHDPILSAARDVIEAGVLGRLVAVAGTALFSKPQDYFDEAPWRRELGGGPILINMIHDIDDLRMLCGEITAVQALASSAVRGFPVEDTVAVNLAFANGALGSFMLSDTAAAAVSWEHTSGENPGYPNVPDLDCYVIAGTSGSLGIPTMRLRTYAGTPSWWQPFESSVLEIERRDPLEEQLRHFCSVIRREAEPLVGGMDAVQTLRVTMAIIEAAGSGRAVPTPGEDDRAGRG